MTSRRTALDQIHLSRRAVLGAGATATLAYSLGLTRSRGLLVASQEMDSITWISPRATLEVLDDYAYWTALEMGYFDDLQTEMEPGIAEATSGGKAVAEGQADMSYVSPGVFSALLDAGTPLVSAWHHVAQETFDFAVPKGSDITEVSQLEGMRVALGDPGWTLITDPMFAQAGVDPASIQYVMAGATWAQAVDQGQADASLCWEGLRAQWAATGFDYDYILGKNWSVFPSNSYQIRRSDFEDESLHDLYIRYLRGWAMGMEFGYWNPRAATQITMAQEEIGPALNETFEDKAVAVESMWQNAQIYRGDWENREGWGWHDLESWQTYFDQLAELGQIENEIVAEDVCKNDFIAGANDFDVEQVKADALAYELNDEFAAVPIPEDAGFTEADFEG